MEVGGFPKDQAVDFWMVENGSAPGDSVLPEPGDKIIKVGTLKQEGESAGLEADLGRDAFAGFEPDLFVVTRKDMSPLDSRVLLGLDTLFHKLHRSKQQGRFGAIAGTSS